MRIVIGSEMKHKHYDCIVAWANGEKIEWLDEEFNEWLLDLNPMWHLDRQYRIKKEPEIEVKYFYKDFVGDLVRYKEFEPDLEKWDLKITYQDGKAIKAEVAE